MDLDLDVYMELDATFRMDEMTKSVYLQFVHRLGMIACLMLLLAEAIAILCC